jgi:hypothetical protein
LANGQFPSALLTKLAELEGFKETYQVDTLNKDDYKIITEEVGRYWKAIYEVTIVQTKDGKVMTEKQAIKEKKTDYKVLHKKGGTAFNFVKGPPDPSGPNSQFKNVLNLYTGRQHSKQLYMNFMQTKGAEFVTEFPCDDDIIAALNNGEKSLGEGGEGFTMQSLLGAGKLKDIFNDKHHRMDTAGHFTSKSDDWVVKKIWKKQAPLYPSDPGGEQLEAQIVLPGWIIADKYSQREYYITKAIDDSGQCKLAIFYNVNPKLTYHKPEPLPVPVGLKPKQRVKRAYSYIYNKERAPGGEVLYGFIDLEYERRTWRGLRTGPWVPMPVALWFQHIPTETMEAHKVKWQDETKVQGKEVIPISYKWGMPRKITFDLFVNELGVRSVYRHGQNVDLPCEVVVNWLSDRMYGRSKGMEPRVLVFSGWDIFNVVITDMKVKREILRKFDAPAVTHPIPFTRRAGQMIRGRIALELTEWVGPVAVSKTDRGKRTLEDKKAYNAQRQQNIKKGTVKSK